MLFLRRQAVPKARRGFRPLSLLLLLLLLVVLPLEDTQPDSAKASYDQAWRLFQSGYFALSQQEAEAAVKRYQSSDPAWASRFTLLEADSMLYRGMYEDALHVLSTFRESAMPTAGM